MGWFTYMKDNTAGLTKWQGQLSKIPETILFEHQGYMGITTQDQFITPDGAVSILKVNIA